MKKKIISALLCVTMVATMAGLPKSNAYCTGEVSGERWSNLYSGFRRFCLV